VIGKALGKKTLLLYIGCIIIGAIISGLTVDYLLPHDWFNMNRMNHNVIHSVHVHDSFSWLKTAATVVLICLLINAFVQKMRVSYRLKKINFTTIYKVRGMTCNHCKATVENGLSQLSGVRSVQVDLAKSLVYVEGIPADNQIKKTIEYLGFEYSGKIE